MAYGMCSHLVELCNPFSYSYICSTMHVNALVTQRHLQHNVLTHGHLEYNDLMRLSQPLYCSRHLKSSPVLQIDKMHVVVLLLIRAMDSYLLENIVRHYVPSI
jgi:hypothetical protein